MAAEIIVQPGNSIQNAINNSSPGDIVTVKPGTYTESIKVSKSDLTIRSESGNPDNTIIKARSKGTDVLLLQGNDIRVNGFKIIGASSSYAGIGLSSCSNCIIENNKLLNNSRGVYLLRSSGITVSKNNAANSGEYGIALQGSSGNTVSGNTASNNARGIYLGTSDKNTLSSNTVQGNSVYGFFICGLSDYNHIYNNYFNNIETTIRNGKGNSYNTVKTAGTNIVGGPYIGGNFWGKPDGTGFSQTSVDRDGDGISDSAYTNITGSTYSDNLPLVTPGSAPILPVADFSSDVTSGKVPLSVGFTDNSAGAPTSWAWNFGDETSSTQQNPVHTYSKAGNYTVTLKVSNAQGSNTTTKTEYIKALGTAPQIPVAEFSAFPTSGTAPQNVTFTDSSTGTPTAWNWSFGDGKYSTDKNPVHTYSVAGNYTVTLTASNSAGNDTVTKSDYIKVGGAVPPKPVVSFLGSPVSGSAPLSVTFTDSSTGSPTAWNWSFGDGTYSTVQNPTHTYSTAGNYTVTLTATNAGGSATQTKSDYIKVAGTSPQKPIAVFSGSPTSGNAPLSVTFTDSSTGSPTAWSWNFGDGTTSAAQNPVHTYSTAGNYTVTLTVSNSAGSNTTTKPNYITAGTNLQKPVVSFWGSRTSGTAPLTITFTDASTNTPTAWNWSFGDGTYSTVQRPRHTYSTAGSYTVTLNASNAAGTGTKTRADYIKLTGTSPQMPATAFSASPTSGKTPLSVTFTDSSTGSPIVWSWNFGDGTTSAAQNPVHTYSTTGNYTVTLTVSNTAGSNTATKSNYIKVTSSSTTNATVPVVSFWGSRTSGTAPLTITFTDASTNTPTAWYWSFGDGTYSTLQRPRHTYSKAGTYSITLKASNAAGSGTKTRANYIKIT